MIAATVFGAALAVPAAAQIIHAVEYTDIFDNRLGTIPAIDPVGNTSTGALSYNGWEYYDAALQSNVVPVTGPNVAAFFGSGEFEAGEDVWKPRNASVISFNQQSLAYGCVSNTEEPAVAVPCTLQVSAQRADGTTVTQNLTYTPRELRNGMNTASFPSSFSNLESLTIQVLSSPVALEIVAPIVDNNTYTAFIRS